MVQQPASRFGWLFEERPHSKRRRPTRDEFLAACQFALAHWQVLPVVGPRVLHWGRDVAEDTPYVQQIEDLVTAVKTLAQVQLLLCKRLAEHLEGRRVPYTLLKGIAARLCAYPMPDLRCGLDVDIGVTRKYLQMAEDVAARLGFVPASLVESGRHFARVTAAERASVEANHYELACLVRRQVVRGLSPTVAGAIRRCIPALKPWHETSDGDLACYVTIDVHHGLCLDISVDEVVASAQRWRLEKASFSVPAFHWLVFHLIFKLYWEGVHNYRKGGYQYADLTRLVTRLSDKAAMSLVDLLERYRLEAAAFYVLRRLDTDIACRLPHALREFVQIASIPPRDEFPNDVNDLGDMWPKVWGYR